MSHPALISVNLCGAMQDQILAGSTKRQQRTRERFKVRFDWSNGAEVRQDG